MFELIIVALIYAMGVYLARYILTNINDKKIDDVINSISLLSWLVVILIVIINFFDIVNFVVDFTINTFKKLTKNMKWRF